MNTTMPENRPGPVTGSALAQQATVGMTSHAETEQAHLDTAITVIDWEVDSVSLKDEPEAGTASSDGSSVGFKAVA